ncbi:MAG: ABC transporter substrate-binding protein [Anaerolineae bacterium]
MPRPDSRDVWRRGHRRWAAGAILILTALIVLLWAVLPRDGPLLRDRTWDRIRAGGVLKVGMDASFPPFEMMDPESGEIRGLDVDLARALAVELGVRAELLNVGFDSLYDQLLAGRFDAIISALPVDYTWTEDVRYSEPYFQAGLLLVTTQELSPTIRRVEDLVGRRVAVEWGSEGDAYIRRLEREHGQVEVLAKDSPAEAVEAVRTGMAEACLVDAVSAYQGIGGDTSLVIVGAPLTEASYAIAVRRKSPILARQMNAALARLRDAGVLDELIRKWMTVQ